LIIEFSKTPVHGTRTGVQSKATISVPGKQNGDDYHQTKYEDEKFESVD